MIDFEPVEKRLARGNARYSLKNTVYNVEWEEEKHPRGEDGKFGTGGGSKKSGKKSEKKEKLTTLNPTGGVFVDYKPEDIYAMELGENMTTLAKTSEIDPDEKITVYRGVSTGKGKISPGDFITTNKQLAQDYAGTGNVVSMEVRAGDILDDDDEPLGEEYIYYPEKKSEKNKTDKTSSPEFKKWFGKSKVLDKEGNPLKVYHGTNKDINTFNPDKGYSPTDRLGSWFGVNKEVAEKRAKSYVEAKGGEKKIYETYLKIENPKTFKTRQEVETYVEKNMILDFEEIPDIKEMMEELYTESPEDFKGSVSDLENYNTDSKARERVNKDILNSGDAFSDDIAEYVRKTMKEYDGMKIEDDQGEGAVYVAFNPNQIKSADNTGTFDPDTNNINNSSRKIKVYRVK